MRNPFISLLLSIFSLGLNASHAQKAEFNYDEAKVPAYELPDPLRCLDQTPVNTSAVWREKRRPEILALFEEEEISQRNLSPQQCLQHRTDGRILSC